MTRPDVRSLAAELPRLLATLPADAGEAVRVEIEDGEVRVVTATEWTPLGGAARLVAESCVQTVWSNRATFGPGDKLEIVEQSPRMRTLDGSFGVFAVREDAGQPMPSGGLRIQD